MALSKETEKRLQKWAEDLSIPIEELQEKFNIKFAMLKKVLEDQDVSDSTIEAKARSQLANEIRPGRSRAPTYEGIVLGFGRCSDWNEFFFNINRHAYNEDSMQAVAEGVTDSDGRPLWTQEQVDRKGQFFRGQVGDFIEPEYERHVLAIGRPVLQEDEKDAAIRLFWIKLSGDPTQFNAQNPAPKPGQVCRWRCNIQEVHEDLNLIRANGATITRFEPAEFLAGKGTDREKVLTGILEPKMCRSLLNQVHTSFKDWDLGNGETRPLDVDDVPEWLESHSDKKGRLTASHFIVLETDILGMYKTGMRLGNADQQDLAEIPSMFVNLDENIINEMYYGEGSTVLAAVEPFMRKQRRDGKVVMDENNKPIMEATGECIAIFPVIAMPKIAPAEEVQEKQEATIEL